MRERRIDLVGRFDLYGSRRLLEEALSIHRLRLVLIEAPLAEVDLDFLRLCSERGIRVLALACPSYGLALGGSSLVRLGGLPWLRLRPLPVGWRHRLGKRVFDLGLVLVFAPLHVPLMALIAFAVVLSSPGGVLHRQTRVGRGGRLFVLLKFRTMRADAETASGPVLCCPGDPRVTRVGRFLRRRRLDELPQLWNVLRGEMSLVGPRPERPELTAGFDALPHYGLRHLLQPGLTGVAQLVGGYAATPEDKLRCDLIYLSSRSLWFDIRLIAATLADFVRSFPGG